MHIERIRFANRKGQELAGILELPPDRRPHNSAILAHCFTCSKDLTAARNITRALTGAGFAVLRFDFTGLGESEGEFETTSFSTNIDDLVEAADFLGGNVMPPSLLVGHSLGGAAVLMAAERLDSVRAVATIGAPFEPRHVGHLFHSEKDEILAQGSAEVTIGGRSFRLGKGFLDDLKQWDPAQHLAALRKAILLMHAPLDDIVGIDNAAEIFVAAKHPKSFVSLDRADHLLSSAADSNYAGMVIAAWATRYVDIPAAAELPTDQQVVAVVDDDPGFTTRLRAGRHGLVADEPASVGGRDFGPTPYDYLIAGLGACTAMTMKMYARRKQWVLTQAAVHLTHQKIHAEDCADCEQKTGRIDRVTRTIELEGELDQEQRQRLLEIADRCPVHRTLDTGINIVTELKD